ncbi:MAG: phosphatase PAP2 family protein [Saprospiraceae bacterium]
MLNHLNWYDHRIFEWIQVHLHGDSLNLIISLFRDKFFWVPLYLMLISWIAIYNKKHFYIILISSFIVVALTDQFSSNLLKKFFKRERPCRELYFKDHFESLINCSGGYSFPSTHATNHAGIGIFLFLILSKSLPRGRYFLLIWPVLIGFAQIFVGVHFPFDVVFGLILGNLIGFVCFRLLQTILSKFKNLGTI